MKAGTVIDLRAENEFAMDSPLEQGRFELVVPL
jgi:hypothetical protein